jgi:hypothetical protein
MDFDDTFQARTLKSYEISFSHWLLPVVCETMNSRTQGSMHVMATAKIGVNEYK